MIDVHSHIIPFVDDGSKTMEISLAMLKDEVGEGVTEVILTPHYRVKQYVTTQEEVVKNFNLLNSEVQKCGIPIKLHLGREISVDDRNRDHIKSGDFISLANTYYVLLEFPFFDKTDIDEVCYEVKLLGYIPVVAHAERYAYFRDYDAVAALRKSGVLIQVNAAAIVGDVSRQERLFVRGLLKRKLIDLVGSDIHSTRINRMSDAYKKVAKKDAEYADKIFRANAEMILNSEKRK